MTHRFVTIMALIICRYLETCNDSREGGSFSFVRYPHGRSMRATGFIHAFEDNAAVNGMAGGSQNRISLRNNFKRL